MGNHICDLSYSIIMWGGLSVENPFANQEQSNKNGPQHNNRRNSSRGSISGGVAGELVKAAGDGILPVTLRMLHNSKDGIGSDGSMHIAEAPRSAVRIIGWIIPGTVEEENGEFLFQFTDGSVIDPLTVLMSIGGTENGGRSEKGTKCNKIIERCTLRGGSIMGKIMICGAVGKSGEEIVFRASHVREADPIHAALYHPFEVLHAQMISPSQIEEDGISFPKNVETSNDVISLEDILSTVVPDEYCGELNKDDLVEKRLAHAIQYIKMKEEGSDMGKRGFAHVKSVLDLLENYVELGTKREEYLQKINEKVTEYSWFTACEAGQNGVSDEDFVYFLGDAD